MLLPGVHPCTLGSWGRGGEGTCSLGQEQGLEHRPLLLGTEQGPVEAKSTEGLMGFCLKGVQYIGGACLGLAFSLPLWEEAARSS